MAARTEAPKFGSFVLGAASGVTILDWRDRILHRARYTDRMKGDGALLVADKYTGRSITITGRVQGSDSGDAKDKMDDVLENFANSEQYLQFYDDRKILARLSRNVDISFVKGTSGATIGFRASFRSRWPTYQAAAATTDSFTPSGTGPNDMVTSSIGGEAATFPKITLTNSTTGFTDKQVTLTNLSTGKQLVLSGFSMANGDAIVVDMREGRIGDGTTVPTYPRSRSGQWWSLTNGATQTIQLEHDVGSGASWAVAVAYSAQHWQF